MYQIAGKIRYVLRGLGILAGGLLITAVAFAVLLPFVVDAEAIRGPLTESLSAWSGGPVSIAGPLRIGSFADLSVEASYVDLKSTAGKGPSELRGPSLSKPSSGFPHFFTASLISGNSSSIHPTSCFAAG